MKRVWFGIAIMILGFGFLVKRKVRQDTAAPPPPAVAKAAFPIPAAVGIPPPDPYSRVDSPTLQVPDRLTPRLEKIADLARYALPTQENRLALIEQLSDPALQSELGRILGAHDHKSYDAAQEKLRMNAISTLGLMLKYKDVENRDDVVRSVKQRILAVDFQRMNDIQIKQSVYGDITELLMILKQHDPESYEDVSQRIQETNNKVLQTALAASR